MPRTQIPIAQGFYVDESIPIAAQQCVNFYPHIPTTKTISDASLLGVDGIELAVSVGDDLFNRGSHDMDGIPYFVNGNTLFNVTYTTDLDGVRDYSVNSIAGTINGMDRVMMSDNGEQLCIIAPDDNSQFNAWIYTIDGGLVQISDTDFDGPVIGVTFFDGYFFFLKKDSNKFFSSDLRDGLSYIATDFASAESDPDNLVATAPLNGLLYIFGTVTCEQYYDQGGTGFSLARATSGVIQKGCAAPNSLTEFNGSLVWIGGGDSEKPSIWISSGDFPQKLSTAPIDNIINAGGIDRLSNAFVIRWAEKGHNFLSFTVPDVCTVVYDTQSGLWHERKSVNEFSQLVPWRVASLVYSYSAFLVGDLLSGNIGIMSDQIYREYDDEIHGYFTTPAIDNNGMPFSINSFELMMQTGVVPLLGQGSNPIIRLSVSKDGGRTFSPEMQIKMGIQGDYTIRVIRNLLGRYSRSCVFRFDISEPIKRVIVKGEIDIAA